MSGAVYSIHELVPLFDRGLSMCNLRAGEKVAILCSGRSRREYVDAVLAVGELRGAHMVSVQLHPRQVWNSPYVRSGTGAGLAALGHLPELLQFLRACDMVIDLTEEGFIHAREREQITEAGARMLFVTEPPEVLERLFPTEETKERVLRHQDRLARARTMRVTSKAGTDLTASLVGAPVGYQYGFAEKPGRWDHWPSAQVVCYPPSETIRGTVVLDVGDIIFPLKRYVHDRVHITVQAGKIVDIEGGIDAVLLNDYLSLDDGENPYYISHIGWGLLRGGKWGALHLFDRESQMGMEGRGVDGNFLISTGPNRHAGRLTPCHLDIPMRNCTIALDGETVVEEGVILEERFQ